MRVFTSVTSARQMKCCNDVFPGILHIIKDIYSMG